MFAVSEVEPLRCSESHLDLEGFSQVLRRIENSGGMTRLTLIDLTCSGWTSEAVYSNSGRYIGLVLTSLLLHTIVAAGFSA
jgi:hypothetical protein